MGRVLYAVVSYVFFLAAMLWLVAFLAGVASPLKTIDSGDAPYPPFAQALGIDLGLLALFAVQHSVMARPAFKQWWTRIVPPEIERATYVLVSTLLLVVLLALWAPLPALVWNVENDAVAAAIWCLYALGWLVVIVSSFLIDHLHFVGITQARRAMNREAPPEPPFRRVLFYRFVRHPLMLGFLVAFWATPSMTVGHLVFAVVMTAYILAGVRFEERDLRAAIGEPYEAYRREVPMLFPRPRGKR